LPQEDDSQRPAKRGAKRPIVKKRGGCLDITGNVRRVGKKKRGDKMVCEEVLPKHWGGFLFKKEKKKFGNEVMGNQRGKEKKNGTMLISHVITSAYRLSGKD